MSTLINYRKLALTPKGDRRAALCLAIRHELARIPDLFDAMGKMAALRSRAIHSTPTRFDGAFVEKMFGQYSQKYATPSDATTLTGAAHVVSYFQHEFANFNWGFQLLFDFVDMRGIPYDSFETVRTHLATTFDEREPGGRTEVRRDLSEDVSEVPVIEYADGLGILDRWVDSQRWVRIDDALNDFIYGYYSNMAARHYALFTALDSSIDVTFSVDDQTTFAAAIAALLRGCAAQGVPVGESPDLYILTAPEKLGRVQAMLTAQQGALIVAATDSHPAFSPQVRGVITSPEISASDTGYYLILPGRKLKRGVWKDLTLQHDRNIELSATDWVGVGQYNAIVGDSNQVRRVKFA